MQPAEAANWNAKVTAYLEAVVKHFENKKDLTMVLGAGDQEKDYQRFAEENFHHFLVTNERTNAVTTRVLDPKTTISTIQATKPIVLPLDFNHEQTFFFFLAYFKNKFKKIIFDLGVTKALAWDETKFSRISSLLQNDGAFYIDQSLAQSILLQFGEQLYRPAYIFNNSNFEGKEGARRYKIPNIFMTMELKSELAGHSVPSKQEIIQHNVNYLENLTFGHLKAFEAVELITPEDIKKDPAKKYPLPGVNVDNITYILARKKSTLGMLKAGLGGLKQKLDALRQGLETLRR